MSAEPKTTRRSPGRYLKLADVTAETSLHRATIYRRASRGEFPKPVPIGGRRVAWRECDIERWKADQEAAAS
ncbi:hypothetical protein B5C34_09510 [Pacificimonas flava]|uniref:AlpA family phage regulatory protein n=2 Tax=Pacificimonas TaxID=1960290 RepID=A0A219B5P7_9SPHN|nr:MULTISPECIES: AlpA family phage regulatory protein [Pacificimonas]MBZ6379092.1 AlpA family phage regulatory protein [Pacificimonas aurantium]OWV33675.1 hypothetical protein B5C34_09510 [Pacificimonas flava]